MTTLTHSFSSIKMFENCPLNYYRQRVLKEVKDPGSAVTAYGDRVHKSLERRLRDNEVLSPDVAKLDALCVGIEKLADAADAVLTVEEEMTLTKELTPTGWWDADAWLRSKIDVLVRRGEKAFMFDWKTGKRRPDFFQMELFAVQIFAHYPDIQRVRASFVWLQTNEMDSQTYVRDADEARIWRDILAKTTRIEGALTANTWPAKPSGLCNWCPCKPTCNFAR